MDVWQHRFRHHFSHTWLDRGGPEGDLMELNGRTSPQMLRIYGASARLRPLRTSYGSPLLHADCTALPRQPLLYARERCRLARNGGPPPAQGKRGTAARRRLAAPVGPPPGRRGLCRRPRRGQSPCPFPAEAVALVVIVSPFSRARTTGFRHSRADRAAGSTRAEARTLSGDRAAFWPARTSPIWAAARVPLSSLLRSRLWRAGGAPLKP